MRKTQNSAQSLLTTLALTASVQLLFSPAAIAQSATTIVVSGLGGNETYNEQFVEYSNVIADHARQLAKNESDVMLLQGNQATRQNILKAISDLQQRNAEDSIRIFLIGHGSFDGNEYKYNVPGPDVTGSELIDAVNQLPANQQLLVLATSSSGAVFEPLAAANRVVITATKNGRERNAVKFTEHLVNGMTDPSADTDKDETVSAQELYQYAERAVAKHYESEKLLASEHSRLSGDNAANFELARYGVLLANQAEISEELITERKEISAQITSLRSRKSDLTEDDYFDQLQSLMLELATIQRAIDAPADTVEPLSEQSPSGQSLSEQAPAAVDNSVPAPSDNEAAPGVD